MCVSMIFVYALVLQEISLRRLCVLPHLARSLRRNDLIGKADFIRLLNTVMYREARPSLSIIRMCEGFLEIAISGTSDAALFLFS